jgi:hypothetical protein
MTPEQKTWFDHIQESRRLKITMKSYCASRQLRYGEMIRRKKLLEPHLKERPTSFVDLKVKIPLSQTMRLKFHGKGGRVIDIEGSCAQVSQLIESIL